MTSYHWTTDYTKACRRPVDLKRRPLIGITGNYGKKGLELAEGYWLSVYEAGGTPVAIPPLEGTDDLECLLERVDGLIFSGGSDLDPLLVDEEPHVALHSICHRRDRKELLLMRMALDRQIPMLCICRGIQLLAVVTGGHVVQDLGSAPAFKDRLIKHSQDAERSYPSHSVTLARDSLIRQLFHGEERIYVNSFHHQAVDSVGSNMSISGQSADGVIEAIESTAFKSVIGVQWHPECFILRGDRSMLPLFEWLTTEATQYATARHLHQHIISLDSHCDTPMFFSKGIRFAERDDQILVDLHKMREGYLDACIMAAYLPQGPLDREAEAQQCCDNLLDGIEREIGRVEGVGMAETAADIRRLKCNGKKAILRGIENGYAIGSNLGLVEHYRRRGVVYMTLCHNGDNLICDSASKSEGRNGGLSAFGREVVKEMNRVGMMIDLSHGGEQSFWQALELSRQPIICSHSSCKVLCNHPRNLTDQQLKALADKGGVCQVTLYPGFLRTDGEATIMDAMDHLLHAVEIVGVDHVGLGSDFDGDGGVKGLANASEMINFTRQLLAHHFSESDIEKIWGGNLLRVMEQVQAAATWKIK
ncbi:MAG: membrane dipeptidase [Bacteroidaceae bacterium]|nr:membrane dipeptidase [Bacteroidaceae bacterium]